MLSLLRMNLSISISLAKIQVVSVKSHLIVEHAVHSILNIPFLQAALVLRCSFYWSVSHARTLLGFAPMCPFSLGK